MALFMVFVRNLSTNQDFVVPASTANASEAFGEVTKRYPGPAYTTLTCFEKNELQGILNDANRWPGVASVVQPTLEEALRRVTSGTRLPPLTRTAAPKLQPVQAPAPSTATRASVTQTEMQPLVQTATVATTTRMSKDQQALAMLDGLAARLKARTEQAEMRTAMNPQPQVQQPVQQRVTRTAVGATPMTPQVAANTGRSVIDVLRALRG